MSKFANLEILYRWSRRRQSIGLMVTTDGKLVVTAPVGASQARIAQALAKHRAWIARKVAERREAWARLQEGETFYLGKPYRLRVVAGGPAAVAALREEIRVQLSDEELDPWPRLHAWYRLQAESLLTARVRHFQARMRVTPGPVALRDWQRRWGECHPDGHLRFNWRLILLPPEIIDYVVVHELAHLKVPGHNPRFWGQVAAVLPDWQERRRWLNWEGAPFLLWRP